MIKIQRTHTPHQAHMTHAVCVPLPVLFTPANSVIPTADTIVADAGELYGCVDNSDM